MGNKVQFVKGIHYGDEVQSASNIEVTKLGDEIYLLQVYDEIEYDSQTDSPITKNYEPIMLTPNSDLSSIDPEFLEQFSWQFSYAGESTDQWIREAKFSKTRANIDYYWEKNKDIVSIDTILRMVKHKQKVPRNKLFKLRLGGFDQYSKMTPKQLIPLINLDQLRIINSSFDTPTEKASATRWLLRGLPIELAIDKVKCDAEISKAKKQRYQ